MNNAPPTIAVLVLRGVLDSALALVWDALSSASTSSMLAGLPSPRLLRVSVPARLPVTASGNQPRIDATTVAVGEPTVIVIPSFGLGSSASLARRLEEDDVLEARRWIAGCYAQGCTVAAGANTAFILGEMGLLDGRRCTTSPNLIDELRRRYPDAIVDRTRSVTSSGRTLCASSPLAHFDLALEVTRRVAGPRIAQEVDQAFGAERSATPGAVVESDNLDAARAEVWVRENLSRRFQIADIARAVGVSPRTLARRIFDAAGIAPREFVQRIRLERAQHLIATTTMTIDQVAAAVGHRDSTQLRRIFRRATGRTPSQHRRPPGLRRAEPS